MVYKKYLIYVNSCFLTSTDKNKPTNTLNTILKSILIYKEN